jgi:hypothetical protein
MAREVPGDAFAALAPDLTGLARAKRIYIATVRKDGTQSTPAPVWFTTAPDGTVLIQTRPTTWMARRIRRGSPVIVWTHGRSGPAFLGNAEICDDPAVVQRIVAGYPQKYFLARLGFHRPTQRLFSEGRIVAIRIEPIRKLPSGFISRPGTPAPSAG